MGNARWKSYRAQYLETDLWVAVDSESYTSETESYTMDRILCYRSILADHIKEHPEFQSSLAPLLTPTGVHPLVYEMYEASRVSGTGPMSAVAGAIAEHICNDLLSKFRLREVIIENGGDIFMKITSPLTISVYAGSSSLSDRIGLAIKPEDTPLSVCCSSGTVGHSLSFGIADACVIACRSGSQADAYATAFCNEVKSIDMISKVTELALQNPDIMSVVIIKDDKIGLGGRIEVIVRKSGKESNIF
jgi:ApbE superfamily uncharacterized protein (UPF0280 family)